MLGMELLDQFDTDLDFPAGRLRFWHPGDGCASNGGAGALMGGGALMGPLVEAPSAVLNETGLLGGLTGRSYPR
eukprot:589107-Prorocentrum_minimum.AAC.1